MPDSAKLLEAMAAAVVVAAAALLLFGWKRTGRSWPAVLAVGLGFAAGCACVGVRPHWPPREDQDRFLLVLFPAVLAIELLAAALGKWAWAMRGTLAAAAAWILLYNSVYLAELAGPGSREWTPGQSFLILGALAAGLIAVWGSLTAFAHREGGWAVSPSVALVCGGAGLVVMLSGYASGGQLGVPLAGAMAGVAIVCLLRGGQVEISGAIGVAVVGLFALLVTGRFFGQLTTQHAVALFLAPLLVGAMEIATSHWFGPRLRGSLAVGLAVAPVAVVVWLAGQKFMIESSRASSNGKEASAEDYMNYER